MLPGNFVVEDFDKSHSAFALVTIRKHPMIPRQGFQKILFYIAPVTALLSQSNLSR